MKVKPKVPVYEVFRLENSDQLTKLRDWLGERGWLMQIQKWEAEGYFRPENYINTNWFDVFFNIGQYVLVETDQGYWHIRPLITADDLDSFIIIEE